MPMMVHHREYKLLENSHVNQYLGKHVSFSLKGLDSTVAKVVPVFIEFMTPAGAICSRNQRTVIIR